MRLSKIIRYYFNLPKIIGSYFFTLNKEEIAHLEKLLLENDLT
jgi:hypothetical protein